MMRNEPLQPVRVEEPFRLTREEQEFVRNCASTQLWRNELPWSLATGILTRMAMKAGMIKYSQITLFSTVLGAFVCSRAVSYSTCFQKLIQQPGSTVAERMNQSKRIITFQNADRNPAGSQATVPDLGYAQPNYLDVDIDKPDYPGIDPSVPNPNADEAVAPPRPGLTYAELRRQNREAYQQQFRGPRPSPPPPSIEQPANIPQGLPTSSPYESSSSHSYDNPSYSFDSAIGSYDRPGHAERSSYQHPTVSDKSTFEAPSPARRTRTNKYGDIWEE